MKYRIHIYNIVLVFTSLLAVNVCNGQVKAEALLKLDRIPADITREIRTVTDSGIHLEDTVFFGLVSLAKREYSFMKVSQSGDTSIFAGNENGIHYKLLVVFDSLSNMFKSFHLVDTSESGWWKLVMKLENIPVKDSMGYVVSTTSGSQLGSSLLSFIYHDVWGDDKERTTFDAALRNDFRSNSTVYFKSKGFFSTHTDLVRNMDGSMNIYPNPASNILSVGMGSINEKVEFFDQLGREVHIPEISRINELVSFNTSSLIPGIYWLRTGSQKQKIVIQR